MTRHRQMTRSLLAAVLLASTCVHAHAEVVLDGTVGSRGPLTLNGQDIRITPDMGTTSGGNLFHSFEKFGVPQGDAVTFEGPDSINNVISRVTGPDASQIHGTLRSTVPFASFWLINPNGVIVGKEGIIDVPNALHLSTADELRFEDGSTFSARNPAGSRLSVAEPSAFGFLGGQVGELRVEAPFLTTEIARGISLTGGAVTIDGTFIDSDGRILIAAQERTGDVQIYRPDATARDGRVTLRSGADIVAYLLLPEEALRIEGGQVGIDASNLTAFSISSLALEGSPSIAVAGNAVRIDGGGDLAYGQIATRALGSDRAPSISISGKDILISRGAAYSLASETGLSGNVTLQGERVTIADGTVVGSPSVDVGPVGKGGRTLITASDKLVLTNNGQILSFTQSAADAGDVVLQVGDLQMNDSSIATSSNGGAGKAGLILIDAAGTASIDGASTVGAFTITDAQGGSIQISGTSIDIAGDTRITTSTNSDGNAGDISISGETVKIRELALVDSTSTGSGNAGGIRIASTEETRLDGGVVSTGANPGSGGTIVLLVGKRLVLENGGVVATNIEGAVPGEQAGSVTVSGINDATGGPVVLDTTSLLVARAPNVGDGGTIRIATDGLIAQRGQIDASARQGNSGTVASTSPETNIVSGLAGLDAQTAGADSVLATSCDARDVVSSLIVGAVQRGNQGFDPDQPLGSTDDEHGCADQ